jgi:hypothetical protein
MAVRRSVAGELEERTPLAGRAVLLSVDLPPGGRAAEETAEALREAVWALLGAGATLVTTARPEAASLIAQVVGQLPASGEPRVILYRGDTVQVRDQLGPAGGVECRVVRTPATGVPLGWRDGDHFARRAMIAEMRPVAGIFIGGPEGGVEEEHRLFTASLAPGRLLPGRSGQAEAGARGLVLVEPGGAVCRAPATRAYHTALGSPYPRFFRATAEQIATNLRVLGEPGRGLE